jgi:uroporphyrinogen decarboxylase
MNSRERAIRAIEHEEPDRVPLEGVAWGEWSYPFLEKILLPYFGLAGERGRVMDSSEQLDAIAERLGIDFRAVSVDPPSDFQEKAVYNPLFHNPWGIQVASDALKDEWGIVRQLNATRTQSRVIYHPLQGKESLDDYVFPDPEAPGRFDTAEKLIKRWRDEYAISAIWGGDCFFCQAWYLRGFKDFILDLYTNSKLANELLDNLLKFFKAVGKEFVEMGVDIICIADDVAMQTGMILSPKLWRKHIKPRIKALIDDLKKSGVYILYHTDGNCEAVINDLIEIGVDILNPIQPECLDPARIKQLYGDDLTLSGTISVQETLPYGTVEDVKNEVMRRIETCGHGGGLILSPSNQATLDVKVENFIAIYDTVKRFGRYPLRI